ncbi:MAG: hypothetical protein K0041_07665 [Acidithiobacillus sp.]|nr:hypothetical protein [Acidithiobacillus sp.]
MLNLLDQLASSPLPLGAGKSPTHIAAKITVGEDCSLTVQIPIEIFHLLCAWRGNSYKAAAWLQARIMEVASLSPEAVTHYLNLMIRQQLPTPERAKGQREPLDLPMVEVYSSANHPPHLQHFAH